MPQPTNFFVNLCLGESLQRVEEVSTAAGDNVKKGTEDVEVAHDIQGSIYKKYAIIAGVVVVVIIVIVLIIVGATGGFKPK